MRYDASQLLRESDVTFLTNHRYGLIGQNGVGKSTLLYWVENSKENMSVLYVAQEAVGDDTSAIDAVKQSDEITTRLIKREQELLKQLNDTSGGNNDHVNTLEIEKITEEMKQISTELEQSRCIFSTFTCSINFTWFVIYYRNAKCTYIITFRWMENAIGISICIISPTVVIIIR